MSTLQSLDVGQWPDGKRIWQAQGGNDHVWSLWRREDGQWVDTGYRVGHARGEQHWASGPDGWRRDGCMNTLIAMAVAEGEERKASGPDGNSG